MERYARRCDVTGKGMNEGWVWGEGAYYTSTEEDTIAELRSDLLQDEISVDEMLAMTDDELMQYAYDNEIFYYTEWEEIDDDCYYDAEGNEYEL